MVSGRAGAAGGPLRRERPGGAHPRRHRGSSGARLRGRHGELGRRHDVAAVRGRFRRHRSAASAAAGHGVGARDRLRDLRRRDAVRRDRRSTPARPASPRPARSSTWIPTSRWRRSSATARRRQGQGSDFMGKLLSAGKRVLTGESLFMTVFSNGGGQRQKVAFACALSGQDRRARPAPARRPDALSEGRLPVRGEGHLGRHRVPEAARRRPVRRRGVHPAEARRRRPRLRPRRRHDRRARSRGRRDAARRHRLPGGVRAEGAVRHPDGLGRQDVPVRRRRVVLRHA